MSEPFIGQITIFPYNFPPLGWADCAGQILSISQNAALFSLLGTNYGGNGRSNFALPDLQGRVGIAQGNGAGLSQYVIGENGGEEQVALTQAQSAAHSHSLNATTARGTVNAPSGNLLATGVTGAGREVNTASIYNAASPNIMLTTNSLAPSGGTEAHNNIQPFLVLRYCIAMQGIFPSRN